MICRKFVRKIKIFVGNTFFELPPDLSGGYYKIQSFALAKIFMFLKLIFF